MYVFWSFSSLFFTNSLSDLVEIDRKFSQRDLQCEMGKEN